jgi:uncharacterized protein (TIGR01777 family)
MHVAVSGSSGMIGSALTAALTTGGHRVKRLVRTRTEPSEDAVAWDPQAGTLDHARLEGVEAAVHLAGETVDGRWTNEKKARIRDSRVNSTRLLAETLARLEPRPNVLVCASAVGYYGDRGDEQLTEDSSPGSGFLAGVVREWEASADPAVEAGIRVVNLRFGIVLSEKGGALAKMRLPFRLGVGGAFGSGRQYMSWVAIDDVIGAINHALTTRELSGPANTTAPNPVTNNELTKTLGRVLRRPTIARLPGFALRLALGEFGRDLLSSQRAVPARLLATGYEFRHPELEAALRHVLGK